MTAIKDSVHDYVPVTGVAADLLDVPAVQRLRHIKQLSTVRLVYPSANHTRFEHSLGVYHLADRACDHLDVTGHRAERVRAAALLHDVGHGPYGHQTEDVIRRRTGRHHDEVGDLLGEGRVAAVLEDHGLDPDAVAGLVDGKGELGQLISGELDVDRTDYLLRDAHHTGVPYGTVDPGRFLRALGFRDGDLVLAQGNVQTAESLLVARALMDAAVYRHHVSRIAAAMLERACELLLDAPAGPDVERFRRLTDGELLERLVGTDATAEFGRRIRDRDLYKRALWVERDDIPPELRGLGFATTAEAEREIADAAGLDPRAVVLDSPTEPALKESTVRVVVGDEVRQLDDHSPLVEALHAAARTRWRLGVYASEEHVDTVERAAGRVLGLDTA